MEFGEIIKLVRKKKGLTQAELAQMADIAINSLRRYERGERKPTLYALERIASALGVRIEDLIGLQEFESGEEFEKARNELLGKFANSETESLEVRYRQKAAMDLAMEQLNNEGQRIAVERVEELAEIPKYQKKVEPDND